MIPFLRLIILEHILQGHELRLEVDWGAAVHLTLRSGEAEIFGTSLELGQKFRISGQKIAIFSWKGCTLDVEGTPEVVYQSEDTPMSQYMNVHDTLDARRTKAKAKKGEGPRTLIVGPTDSGKSTLSKILLNYAVRAGWAPIFADLDIGQGAITVPGCISATPVEAPIDIEEGLPTDAPLVYYYGHLTPSDNSALYKRLVERLAAVLEARAAKDPGARAAGMVINSMGWIEALGYEILVHSIQTLKADVVLVVGQERLFNQLQTELKSSGVSVVKLSKSGGVVTRTKELRATARKARVEDYFYGPMKELSPASQTAKIDDFKIYRVGGGPKAPSSALPIGSASISDPLKVSVVSNLRDVLFTIVAVSHADSADLLLSVNVAGFIYIQDVDVTSGTLTYLAPCPGPLPGNLMLAGNFKVYLE